MYGVESMSKKRKSGLIGFVAGLVIALLLASALFYKQFGCLPFSQSSDAIVSAAGKLGWIESLIKDNYLEDVDQDTLDTGMYKGLVAILGDPYSGYYSPEEYVSLMESSKGTYQGMGLVMQKDSETDLIVVVSCYSDSPAEAAGIQAGDLIIGLNGEDVTSWTTTELAAAIKGSTDSQVTLTLQRGEEVLDVSVEIGVIETPVIYSRILDDSIGYIQIAQFTEGTSGQFEAAYAQMKEQNIQGLVIDLRNNPGGLLDSVCDTLEQILPEGMIVYTEDKNGKREEHVCSGETPIEIPLVLLINESSASASEIFAGAVKDHQIGTLVGTVTYGKGIVQKTFPLEDGSAVKLTVSKYYTPNGTNIHGVGIEPDVAAEWEGEEALDSLSQYNELPQAEWLEADSQMRCGLETLKTLMTQQE